MVGEILEVTAHGAALSDPGFTDIGDIDTAVVTLRFASGALGVIDGSRTAGYGYASPRPTPPNSKHSREPYGTARRPR
jgi:predicted dehydrogenase